MKTNNQKGFIVPLLLGGIAVLIIGGGYYFVRKAGSDLFLPTPRTIDQTTSTKNQRPTIIDETKDWKTYTNTQYGFSFQYPVSWKMVKEMQVSSGDYLPNSRNFVAIYPTSYPAQDHSARIDVYEVSLAYVKLYNRYLQNMTSISLIINNITWTKVGNIDYLTERNGKTYHISAPVNLSQQILSTFKFTN